MTGAVLNTLNTRLDADAIALHAAARRGQGAHHRPRVLADDRGRAERRSAQAAARDRRRRQRVHGAGERDRRDRVRGACSPAAIPAFAWRPPADEWDAIALNYTSGTTGNPKGVVYTIAARTSTRSATCSRWSMPHMRSTCGRCRCSTATAGAFRGRSRRSPARTCACARSRPRRSSTLIREHRSRTTVARRSSTTRCSTRRRSCAPASTHKVQAMVAGAAPPAAMIGAWSGSASSSRTCMA